MEANTTIVHFLLVALGSALGGMSRHMLSGWVAHRWGERFPWGTFVVNVTGAFLIGWLAFLPWSGYAAPWDVLPRIFLLYGFLGGYTTVSSFSLQTVNLVQEGQHRAALSNVLGSWASCLLAAFCGSLLASNGTAPIL